MNKDFRSGFVTILGKPNAGKSTLLNRLVGTKIAIATPRQNTTRNRIRGIVTTDDSQIVYMDTPGFIKVNNKLDERMHQSIVQSMDGVDVILFLMPFWKNLDEDYLETIEILKHKNAKKFLLLTKVDKADNKDEVFVKAQELQERNLFDQIIPISSTRDINIDKLVEEIKKNLTDEIPYYDAEQRHEFTEEFYAAEIIREKVLINLNDEVPHQVFVSTTKIDKKKNLTVIEAEIILNRESLKPIVIGKGGEKIKTIGQQARKELERAYNGPVYLDLFVKVRKDWQNKESIIKEFS